MILASLDPKYQRFPMRLARLSIRVLVMGGLAAALIAISHFYLHRWSPKMLQIFLIFMALALAYGIFDLRKVLYSIVFNEKKNAYEINIVYWNTTVPFLLPEENVEIIVKKNPAKRGNPYEVRISNKQKLFHLESESVFWPEKKLVALKELLEQQKISQ